VWAGYVVLALIAVRTVWGLLGPRYARFSNFVFRPARVIAYVKDTLLMRARRYLGHNPAGGAMVIALMVSLVLTGVSGLLVYGAEEGAGPLAGWFAAGHGIWGEVFEEAHEFLANFTLLLVGVHIAGVLVESLLHKENLVRSMFNGYKERRSGDCTGGVSS
jgi:cytochrome b